MAGATPLGQFLAAFGRADTDAWPIQIVANLAALAIVALALWPARRPSPLICGLAGGLLGVDRDRILRLAESRLRAVRGVGRVFTLQGLLLAIAGSQGWDLVIQVRRDTSSAVGAPFISYALVGYPVVGLLTGDTLRNMPLFGVSPCATVTFFFGPMLWAVPPLPKYLLLIPLVWALTAGPPNMATGVVVDYGMLVAAVITTGLIIWRDRVSRPVWETVAASLVFAMMVAWSGHDDVLIGLAMLALNVILARELKGHARPVG